MAETVFDVLNKKLTVLQQSNKDFLESGRAKDYAEYRESCGVIRGLTAAMIEVQDLASNYTDDDDD